MMYKGKKILVITPRFPYPEFGACEQDRAEGVRQLQSLGFEVEVIGMCFNWQNISAIQEFWKKEGIHVYPSVYRFAGTTGITGHIKKLFFFITHPWCLDGSALEYARHDVRHLVQSRIDLFRPDYVWFDYTYLWPLYSIVKRSGLPIIVRSINFEADHFLDEDGKSFFNYLKYIPKYFTEKITAIKADVLFSISPREEAKYIALGAMHVTNLPLRALQHKLGTHEPRHTDTLHVFFSGSTYNVSHNRRALEFIVKDIAPAVFKKHGAAFVFHITGGKFPKDFEPYVRDNVVYEGFVDDMETFLQSMDIALVPSFFGAGMQQKIFEPLARGFPTITHARGLGGYPFEPKTDFLVADDKDSFIEALVTLCSYDVRRTISVAAVSRSRSLFSIPIMDDLVKKALDIL